MATLACLCGYHIKDITDYLPHKAYFHSDLDHFALANLTEDALVGYIQARDEGRLAEFFAERAGPGYPWADERMVSQISTILLWASIPLTSLMYECPSCGRLWVKGPPDEHDKQRFHAYRPEGEERGVFGSRLARLNQRDRDRAHELDAGTIPP